MRTHVYTCNHASILTHAHTKFSYTYTHTHTNSLTHTYMYVQIYPLMLSTNLVFSQRNSQLMNLRDTRSTFFHLYGSIPTVHWHVLAMCMYCTTAQPILVPLLLSTCAVNACCPTFCIHTLIRTWIRLDQTLNLGQHPLCHHLDLVHLETKNFKVIVKRGHFIRLARLLRHKLNTSLSHVHRHGNADTRCEELPKPHQSVSTYST